MPPGIDPGSQAHEDVGLRRFDVLIHILSSRSGDEGDKLPTWTPSAF
jgi:hypothetical protein